MEALRPLDGRDSRVRDFVMKAEESRELLRRLEDFLGFVLPAYQREGKGLSHGRGWLHGRTPSLGRAGRGAEGFLDRLGAGRGRRPSGSGSRVAVSRGPLAFCFGVHNHQPIGNFDSVLVENDRARLPALLLERLADRAPKCA